MDCPSLHFGLFSYSVRDRGVRGFGDLGKLEMAGVQEQVEIKFRLLDGSDIGPSKYPTATSVATVKESILAQWPKEKQNGLRTVNDLKLITGGKILENNRTLAECQSSICDLSGVTTMHVIVQPPSLERGSDKKATSRQKEGNCGCVIL